MDELLPNQRNHHQLKPAIVSCSSSNNNSGMKTDSECKQKRIGGGGGGSRRSSGVTINSKRSPKDDSCCGILSKEVWSGVKVTVLWITYVFLGAIVFMNMETKEVEEETSRDHRVWARFKEVAGGISSMPEVLRLREILLDLCSHPVLNETFGKLEDEAHHHHHHHSNNTNITVLQRVGLNATNPDGVDWWMEVESECVESLRIVHRLTKTTTWSLVDSIYYTMTAVTTIGYGHIYPTSVAGRRFCVLFCMIGVPLTCILLAKSSDMLSNRILALYERAKKRFYQHPRTLLIGITWVYLTLGFILFMFLPSIAISRLEGWTYEESLYVTFITLSTIGFGDYYPGYNEDREHGDLYKMLIVIWIMVALGYWFMLLNFLQKALRKNVPQRIKRFRRRAHNIRSQTAFFRHLVNKVILQRDEEATAGATSGEGVGKKTEEEQRVGALVEEVVGVLDSRRASRASRHLRQSISGQGEMMNESGDAAPTITLAQLLDVKVCVRPQGVPTLRSVIAHSPKEHELTTTFKDLFDHSRRKQETRQQGEEETGEEVTLPLRDVLNLVTLMKTVDDEVNAGVSSSSLHGSSSSVSSPLSTVTSLDNRDYIPLLGGPTSVHGKTKRKGEGAGDVTVSEDLETGGTGVTEYDEDETDYEGEELEEEDN